MSTRVMLIDDHPVVRAGLRAIIEARGCSAIEAGAAGYLLKDVDNETIVRAIIDAAAGAMVLTPGGDERLIAALRAPRVELTDREREVLLLEKLGTTSRSAAASEARRLGLL